MSDGDDCLSEVNSLVSFSDGTIHSMDNMSVQDLSEWPELDGERLQKDQKPQILNEPRKTLPRTPSDQEIDTLVTNTIKQAEITIKKDINIDNQDDIPRSNEAGSGNNKVEPPKDNDGGSIVKENEESTPEVPEPDGPPLIAETHPLVKSVAYLERHGIFRMFQTD
ncbi:uncharacterized protein LOC5522183 isoform X2 [Nematostella vectensis]|uniref:uncharacterized protein LOC5522183 isoform X2 n=1 Tax=Nematostella vectensis TaxID=45351 RepID=UPI00138FA7EB|nr:uncharacterized protein LOC5522183 isoform X2 [Nematostella vectensis]